MSVQNNQIPHHSPELESRVAKLEATMDYVLTTLKELKDEVRQLRADARTDFRILFGVNITTTLGLAGIMAKGFGWL